MTTEYERMIREMWKDLERLIEPQEPIQQKEADDECHDDE